MIYYPKTNDITKLKDMNVIFAINENIQNKSSKIKYFDNIENFYEFIKTKKYTQKTKIAFIGNKKEIKDYASLLEFIIYYKNTKQKIEKEMIKFNSFIKKDTNPIINDALDKFKYANSDGKCIRGTLINLGYNLHKKDNYALKLCASYEAFETSILIHDDIIDNSDLRRGKSTIHKVYSKEFEKYNIDNTPTSLALCIGDIGFYYINEYILNNYKKDKNIIKLLNYYNNVVINTIKGEILDVYLSYIEKNDKNHKLYEDDIMKIYKLKTSIYSIVGPFILGMILSNSKDKEIEKFENLLEPIGISFQIKDDILGIFSDNNTIGKSVVSDIEEFKQTILYSYIKINKSEYLNDLLKLYGNRTNEKDLKKVQEIFITSGALEYAENKMNELFDISKEKINNLIINSDFKNILLGLIIFLRHRKK